MFQFQEVTESYNRSPRYTYEAVQESHEARLSPSHASNYSNMRVTSKHDLFADLEESRLNYSVLLGQEASRMLEESTFLTAFHRDQLKQSLTRTLAQPDPSLSESLPHTDLVIEVNPNYSLLQSSATDVLPPSPQTVCKFKQSNTSFTYVIEEEPPSLSQELIEKYEDLGTPFQIFVTLAERTDVKATFRDFVPSAKRSVERSRELDQNSSCVYGAWSGTEVIVSDRSEDWINALNSQHYRLWTRGAMGVLEKLRTPLGYFVESAMFTTLMTILVVMNTIVLACDHYQISETMESVLTILNNIFTLIFLIEMLLKLMGLGIVGYLRDPMNYLDGTVVIVSVIEFFFLSQSSAVTAFRTIRIFRSFRVLRVARLFRYMKSMLNIIRAISRSLSRIMYLALFLLLLVIIFALIGMQIFGGKFNFEDGRPRAHFDSFLWAFVTVFQVLTIENWQDVLYNGMRSDAGPASCLYFIVWIFVGNFVLLNLFLAILIESFEQSSEEAEEETQASNVDLHSASARKTTPLYSDRLMRKRKQKEQEQLMMIQRINSEEIQSPMGLLTGTSKGPSENGYNELPDTNSFLIFAKSNLFRRYCYIVTSSRRFETLILLVIALSSIKLIADTYIITEPSDSMSQIVSQYLDLAFTIIFTLEFLIKAISLGFVSSPGSYLRDSWNILDFGIVVASVIELSMTDTTISGFKVLRLLRTFRPLRFITQNLSMKIVVVALLESVIALFNVAIVLLLVWLMFAILGVALFGGKMYSCEQPGLDTRTKCEEFGYTWENAPFNFDNVLQAMLTLFVVSSLEGWPEILLDTVDSDDIDRGPSENATEWAVVYFIVFIFIGSFFFLNLFIGVIFETFNESSIAALLLSKDHLLWVEIQELVIRSTPSREVSSRPKNRLRAVCYDITKSSWLDFFIIICILCNTLQMAIAYDTASEEYTNALEALNLVFTVVFILEATVKLIGLGVRSYFHSSWNKFDFFVVVASIVDLIVTYSLNSSLSILRFGPQLIRVIRVLRVSRLVRIFKTLHGIQELITVLAYSFTAVMNVLLLLLLIFFIYAVLGVFLFHDLSPSEYINEYSNFENFGKAMLTLLRISTGESWNMIMASAVQQGGWWYSFYFLSFVTITTFIMLNLFVMVILQAFTDLKTNPKSALQRFNKDTKEFNRMWNSLAAQHNGKRLHCNRLTTLMYALGENLGVSADEDPERVLKKLKFMNIHIEPDGFVYYHDFLHAVLRVKYTKSLTNPNKNVHWKKILRIEEQKTERALQRLRQQAIVAINVQVRATENPINFFFSMIYLKVIFRSWKSYTLKRRSRGNDFSTVTPMHTELVFPGENTLEELGESDYSFHLTH